MTDPFVVIQRFVASKLSPTTRMITFDVSFSMPIAQMKLQFTRTLESFCAFRMAAFEVPSIRVTTHLPFDMVCPHCLLVTLGTSKWFNSTMSKSHMARYVSSVFSSEIASRIWTAKWSVIVVHFDVNSQIRWCFGSMKAACELTFERSLIAVLVFDVTF